MTKEWTLGIPHLIGWVEERDSSKAIFCDPSTNFLIMIWWSTVSNPFVSNPIIFQLQ